MLVATVVCAPLTATSKPPLASTARSRSVKRHRVRITSTLQSPDRRHLVEVTSRGRVRLDGKGVRSGAGKLRGKPIWRRDSNALAFLQRSSFGLQLVVLPRLDHRRPLVWHLPPAADELSKVFWISPRRIGIGAKEMVPRLVVNWSSSTRRYY
jgi:hypothetical protein